jgi:hypothetical protein
MSRPAAQPSRECRLYPARLFAPAPRIDAAMAVAEPPMHSRVASSAADLARDRLERLNKPIWRCSEVADRVQQTPVGPRASDPVEMRDPPANY